LYVNGKDMNPVIDIPPGNKQEPCVAAAWVLWHFPKIFKCIGSMISIIEGVGAYLTLTSFEEKIHYIMEGNCASAHPNLSNHLS
jgi:hypothetical protein